MTKKDYVLLASTILNARNDYMNTNKMLDTYALDFLAIRIANALQSDNPSFNVGVFLTACGIMK